MSDTPFIHYHAWCLHTYIKELLALGHTATEGHDWVLSGARRRTGCPMEMISQWQAVTRPITMNVSFHRYTRKFMTIWFLIRERCQKGNRWICFFLNQAFFFRKAIVKLPILSLKVTYFLPYLACNRFFTHLEEMRNKTCSLNNTRVASLIGWSYVISKLYRIRWYILVYGVLIVLTTNTYQWSNRNPEHNRTTH